MNNEIQEHKYNQNVEVIEMSTWILWFGMVLVLAGSLLAHDSIIIKIGATGEGVGWEHWHT